MIFNCISIPISTNVLDSCVVIERWIFTSFLLLLLPQNTKPNKNHRYHNTSDPPNNTSNDRLSI